MSKLRKGFISCLMVMTVLSMSMVTAIGSADAATAEGGDLIKMEGLSSVYYLGEDGKRYVFPNEDTYFSWYGDFSSVVTIPQDELESYPLGSNVNIRPGTHLVKITTDPKVYAVEEGGSLRAIPDEATAETLYGENWADKVVDVPDAFFVNYTIDEGNEVSADTYPQGSLVKPADGNNVYYINADGEAQPIADEAAFEANRFGWNFIVEADEDYELPTEGAEIDGAQDELLDPSEGTSGEATGPVGSGLSVALANDTPESASIPARLSGSSDLAAATVVPFSKINLTASNDGDVVVEDLKVERTGVGNRNALGKVYLYDGSEKLTSGRTLNVDGEVTFGVDYTVPAGQTETLTIRADISGAETSGNHGFAIAAAGDIETDGASVSGSFPVQGNLMSLADVESATVSGTFSDGNDLSDLKVGEEEQALYEMEITEQSGEEDVLLQSIALTNEGTVDIEDLSNFKLTVSGDTVAELESSDSDRVVMELDEPYRIEDNETFTFKADIDRGADNTVRFELDEITDVIAVGATYGYGPGIDSSGIEQSDTQGTIATSDFSITEADSNPATQDVAKGENDITFLEAELDTAEEGVLVEDLMVDVEFTNVATNSTSTNDYLENMTLYLDGSRVAGPMDVNLSGDKTSATVVFDNDFEVQGLQNLTVEADVTDDANTGRYKATIDSNYITVEDMDGNSITGSEKNGDAEGNNVNVGLGTVALSTDGNFGGRDVVAGSEDLKVGQYILEAADNEDLDINSYTVQITNPGGTLDSDAIDNVYVNEESSQSASIDSEEAFSVNETLAKGESKKISVYLDLDKNASSSNEIKANLSVDAEGAISGDNFELGPKTGQTMTVQKGSLSLAVGAGTPKKQILVAGSEDVKTAEFEFSSESDGFDITEMNFEIVDGGGTVQDGLVTELKVNDNTYKGVSNGTVDITDKVRVEADEETTVDVEVKLNDDFNAFSSGDELYVKLADYEYESDSTGNTETAGSSITTNNKLAVYNTNLTVTTAGGSASSLGNGTNEIMDITFTADENDQATVKQVPVNVSVNEYESSGIEVAEVKLLDEAGDSVASVASTTSADSDSDYLLTLNDAQADGQIAAGGSNTYTVEVDVNNAGSDDSMTAKLLESGFMWDDNEYYDANNAWISGSSITLDDSDITSGNTGGDVSISGSNSKSVNGTSTATFTDVITTTNNNVYSDVTLESFDFDVGESATGTIEAVRVLNESGEVVASSTSFSDDSTETISVDGMSELIELGGSSINFDVEVDHEGMDQDETTDITVDNATGQVGTWSLNGDNFGVGQLDLIDDLSGNYELIR